MANGVYITRSMSFPDPKLLADAVARAAVLGISFSKYVTLLIEKDLAENPARIGVRDLVGFRPPREAPTATDFRYEPPQPTGSALNTEPPPYRAAGAASSVPDAGLAAAAALVPEREAPRPAPSRKPARTTASPSGSGRARGATRPPAPSR